MTDTTLILRVCEKSPKKTDCLYSPLEFIAREQLQISIHTGGVPLEMPVAAGAGDSVDTVQKLQLNREINK